jgi:hypothetical protein
MGGEGDFWGRLLRLLRGGASGLTPVLSLREERQQGALSCRSDLVEADVQERSA